VLAVSSLSQHKNFDVVVDALQLLRDRKFTFVIAGARNGRIFGRTSGDLPRNVLEAGYVTDAELRSLYEQAGCFVYPSLYEGFGLPPLEAMSCGCPVVVSNAASLPEVCGDAALYCDPLNHADVARCIAEVMDNPVLRQQLQDRGLARSREFTWRAAAEQVLRLVEEVGG
jgi:glycosyltransferase involved in cell wall biosynthesis